MIVGLLGPFSFFVALFLIIQIIALKEFFNIATKISTSIIINKSQQIIVICLVSTLFILFSYEVLAKEKLVLLVAIPALIIAFTAYSTKIHVLNIQWILSALLYVSLPIFLFLQMRQQSIILPIGLISFIWINDTMAYLVGSIIGKTPFSKISPKKTWEGTIGGAILCVLVAILWGYYSPYYHLTDWVILSLCAATGGTLGDLYESKLKRTAIIKDSGTLMPGHGGVLDRFDSLLVAVPFAFCYCYLFMPTLNISIF